MYQLFEKACPNPLLSWEPIARVLQKYQIPTHHCQYPALKRSGADPGEPVKKKK